jgi:four helix bundle protein
MKVAKSFRELEVWRVSIDLTEMVYRLTAEFPKQEMYGLTSQMRRAAVSVASNIAEGSARGTKKDFRQFVKLAEGSNSELQTQLMIARRLGFCDDTRSREAESVSIRIGMMLSKLSLYLSKEIPAHPRASNGR